MRNRINPHLNDFLGLRVNNQQAVLERLRDVDVLVADVESRGPHAVLGGNAFTFGTHLFLSEGTTRGVLRVLLHTVSVMTHATVQ